MPSPARIPAPKPKPPAFAALLAPFAASLALLAYMTMNKQDVLQIYVNKDASHRTPHAEHFLAARDSVDAAAIAIRHISDGPALLLDAPKLSADETPAFRTAFEDDFLPGGDLTSGNLIFSSINGEMIISLDAHEYAGTPSISLYPKTHCIDIFFY